MERHELRAGYTRRGVRTRRTPIVRRDRGRALPDTTDSTMTLICIQRLAQHANRP